MTDTQLARQGPFQPDWVSPPGETIEDLLEERGWTQAELAQRTGYTSKHINALLKGRAPISPAAALRLERVFGAPADFWLRREANYQEALERRRASKDLAKENAWLTELPVQEMVKQGWIQNRSTIAEKVAECLAFFGVASVAAWRDQYESPLVAFRSSSRFDKKLGAVAAWLRQGERTATAIECRPFDEQGLRSSLHDLRSLTTIEDPSEFGPRLIDTCARHGIAVAFVPAPKGCPVSGAARWLTPERAMLLLSLRHKTNDHLWFTFFHEAGHLLHHGKRLQFVDMQDGVQNEQEREADEFARDVLIPRHHTTALCSLSAAGRVSAEDVRQFAKRVGVAPGIVVGRLQNEGWLPWTHLNRLKISYCWATDTP